MPTMGHFKRIHYHRRGWAGTRSTAAKRIQRAWRGRKTTRGVVKQVLRNQEPYKYFSQSISSLQAVNNRWTLMANLSTIPFNVDNSPNARTGTKIQLRTLAMRLTLGFPDDYNNLRIALIRGRRVGTLNASDISYDPNGSNDDIHLPFNQKYVDVLFDKTYAGQAQSGGVSSALPPFKFVDINKYLGKICKYTESTTSTTGEQPYNGNAIYLYAVSDSAFASHPTMPGQIRMSFKDLE